MDMDNRQDMQLMGFYDDWVEPNGTFRGGNKLYPSTKKRKGRKSKMLIPYPKWDEEQLDEIMDYNTEVHRRFLIWYLTGISVDIPVGVTFTTIRQQNKLSMM